MKLKIYQQYVFLIMLQYDIYFQIVNIVKYAGISTREERSEKTSSIFVFFCQQQYTQTLLKDL